MDDMSEVEMLNFGTWYSNLKWKIIRKYKLCFIGLHEWWTVSTLVVHDDGERYLESSYEKCNKCPKTRKYR